MAGTQCGTQSLSWPIVLGLVDWGVRDVDSRQKRVYTSVSSTHLSHQCSLVLREVPRSELTKFILTLTQMFCISHLSLT